MPKTRPRKRAPAAADADAPAGTETPVDYMLRVMRDPKAAPSRRDQMAKSATAYLHRKPAPKKKRGASDQSLKKKLEGARETLAGKIAQLRSDGDEEVSG